MARARRSGAVRYFVLQQNNRDTQHVFTGRQPRQAALKAATRGFTGIVLRERGTKKLHLFEGRRVRSSAPKNAPSWMPSQIWRGQVRKKGIRHM
jgi:hypothetical protein